jgi:hypothetical protein
MTSERALQRRCITILENRGCFVIKQETQHRRGVPDVLVLVPWGGYFFVEFKSQTGRLLPIQEQVHQKLRDMVLAPVFVVRSAERLKDIYMTLLAQHQENRERMHSAETVDP